MKQTILLPSKGIFLAMVMARAFGTAHLADVLTKIGFDPADIETINKVPDGDTAFKPEDYVTKVNTTYENKLLNDANFLGKVTFEKLPETQRKAIEAGQYGRFINEYIGHAKKQGIELDDVSDEDKKSLGKLAQKTFDKYQAKLGTPEALVKVQGELAKALQEKATLESDTPTKIKTAEDTVRNSMSQTIKKLVAQNELAGVKGLKVSAGLIVDSLLANLESQYILVTEGTTVKLMQKANPQLEAMDSKGGKITLAQALADAAKAGGAIDDKVEPKPGDKETIIVKVDGKEAIPDYINSKIQQQLKEEGSK